MEFTIPVSYEEFDLEWYMKMFWQDYQSYFKDLKALEQERDETLIQLEQDYEPDADDVLKMVEIFNVEWTQEDLDIIKNLIIKEYNTNRKDAKRRVHERFEEHSWDLMEKYQMDYFSDKLQELEDNIIAPVLYNSKP